MTRRNAYSVLANFTSNPPLCIDRGSDYYLAICTAIVTLREYRVCERIVNLATADLNTLTQRIVNLATADLNTLTH